MTAAVLLFATVSLLNGQLLQAAAAVSDPNCVPTQNCTREFFAGARDICVQIDANTRQCWDACESSNALYSYAGDSTDANVRQAIAMMVQAARTVQNLCPGAEWSPTVECNLGQRCTVYTLYRGICTLETVGNTSVKKCLDMCDTSIAPRDYGAGSGEQDTNMALVEQVRGNQDPAGETTCPGTTVWLWLWFPILLCCLLGCCFASYTAYQYWRRANKNRNRNADYADNYSNEFPEQEQMMMPQDMGPDDYMPVAQDPEMPPPQFEHEPPVASRDLQMPEPQPSVAASRADDPMPVMPPQVEAPQHAPPPPQQTQQQYPQPPSAFAPQGMPGAPSTFYNSHQQFGTVLPAGMTYPPGMGGSMRPQMPQMGGSMYSQQGATYQPRPAYGGMQPATQSYRVG